MSGETIAVFGTQKTLATAGNAIANNSLDVAATPYDVVVDGLGFPDGDFVIAATFAVAPIEGTLLALYAQPMAVDGTNNAEVPESTRPTVFIGSFLVNNVITTQYIVLTARDLPRKATYYIHNASTGQSLAAGWTLKVTPRSYKAAP